jgi:Transglycosylase SLT domain
MEDSIVDRFDAIARHYPSRLAIQDTASSQQFSHLNYNSMHGLVASGFLSVVLLGAAALGGDRFGRASAGESDEVPPVESAQPRPAAPANGAASVAGICDALAAAAAKNDLPADFFARLIWQESRFDPRAVSRAGAQGVAQFMPATASARGLADPFDPIEAIAHAAKLLRDLRREFGNLGLAAAAYNAGSGRVRDWLAGRRGLPRETDAYVRIVTGQPPEQWARVHAGPAETRFAHAVPCQQIADLAAHAPALVMKPLDPWGVQLVGSSSDTAALAAYRRLQERYASILAGREPRVLHHGLARGSMGWARVHVGAESHAGAEKLCAELRAAGGSCTVQRN